METILPLITVVGITVLAVLSPGPNFVVITKNALIYSRQAGVYTAFGVVAGNTIYIMVGALGFTSLITQSEQLFTIIRLIGSTYLVYLGLTLFLPTRKPVAGVTQPFNGIDEQYNKPHLSKWSAFRSGLFTMLMNPTAALFYLATFTSVLPSGSTLSIKLLAALTIFLITLMWHPILAWFFSNQLFQLFYSKSDKWINITLSLILVGLAIRMVSF